MSKSQKEAVDFAKRILKGSKIRTKDILDGYGFYKEVMQDA